jgi:hypothetical protein
MENAAIYAIHTVSMSKLPPSAAKLYWGHGRWGGLKSAVQYKSIGAALRNVRRMVDLGLWTHASVTVSRVG